LPVLLVDALAAGAPYCPATKNHNDWPAAGQTLREFPSQPHPDLSAEQVAMGCLRCLQMVDLPTEGAGLALIYPFLTWNCIKHIVGENTENGTLGGMERFCERGALSPVLQTFFGATQINIGTTNGKDGGDCTRIPGTQTRGEIWILDLSRLCHHGSRHVLSTQIWHDQRRDYPNTTPNSHDCTNGTTATATVD